MIKNRTRYTAVFIFLILLTAVMLCVNLFMGSADISVPEATKMIFGNDDRSTAWSVMNKIRIPRALAALLLGGALSLSGYLLQTFFRNPIAGPFVLGVSSGAKLTVALAMIAAAGGSMHMNAASMIGAAFIGSMISLGFVLVVSGKVRSMPMLVICGVMIGYICSAITDFAVTFAADSDIVNLHSWSLGSFSGTTADDVKIIFAVTAVASAGVFMISKPIDAYRLGEGYAANLGVRIKPLRATLILLSGLLSSCVTAFAGPVSFVGIAVPHIIRVMLHTSKPILLIPACFLGGSIFCLLCDVIARTAFAPTELSISTVTALFGAPVVIVIMIRSKRGEQHE